MLRFAASCWIHCAEMRNDITWSRSDSYSFLHCSLYWASSWSADPWPAWARSASCRATQAVKSGGTGALAAAPLAPVCWAEETAATLSQWVKSSFVMETSPTWATALPGMSLLLAPLSRPPPPQAARPTASRAMSPMGSRSRSVERIGRERVAERWRIPRRVARVPEPWIKRPSRSRASSTSAARTTAGKRCCGVVGDAQRQLRRRTRTARRAAPRAGAWRARSRARSATTARRLAAEAHGLRARPGRT